MKSLFWAVLLSLLAGSAHADLRIFATVPEWAALAKEIGGDHVRVFSATTAMQDPHRIEAKPSLLAQARQANLLIAVGAELEVGWLPLVLRDSGNAAIQPGQAGYFEAAQYVQRLEVPSQVDRVHGDVHAAGNPHIHLDPRNILKVAEVLQARMLALDPGAAEAYRKNYRNFAERWQQAMTRWEKTAASLKGVAVVAHHASFVYLDQWLGLREVGMLEPKPGIEPTSSHLTALLGRLQSQSVRMVLRAPFQQEGPSAWLAGKSGIQAVLLPYTVGGTPGAGDLFGLFDDTLVRLQKGVQ